MKEHKTQVLAALALALALGMAMPGVVFADGGDVVEGDDAGIEALAEGGEDGIETQAAEGENQEGDGAGEADKMVSASELVTVVDDAKADPAYAKYAALETALGALPRDLTTAISAQTKAVTDAIAAVVALKEKVNGTVPDGKNVEQLVKFTDENMPGFKMWRIASEVINDLQKTAGADAQITAESLKGLSLERMSDYYGKIVAFTNRTVANSIVLLNGRISNSKTFDAYHKVGTFIGNVETMLSTKATDEQIATAKAAVVAALPTMVPSVTVGADADNDEIIAAAKQLPNYEKFAALYNSMGFVRALGSNVTVATIDAKYSGKEGEATQLDGYNAMLLAATEIDPQVMVGLVRYELPQTGPDEDKTDVKTPDTGIVGLFESGALDMTTLTLIASVAVASIAGIVLIAKLYLKHKF